MCRCTESVEKSYHKKGYLGDDHVHVVVLDNHHSHLFNLEFLRLMKQNIMSFMSLAYRHIPATGQSTFAVVSGYHSE